MSFAQKHAPISFDDLVFAYDLIEKRLRPYASAKTHGNLILHGPYGTGKSVSARTIAAAAYAETGHSHVEPDQFNASDVKDVDFDIQKGIFARHGWANGLDEPYIIIDEVDQLSVKQQRALRGFCDKWPSYHFIFTTNRLDAVDGGIRDRSECVEMPVPSPSRWLERAQSILSKEGVKIDDGKVLNVLNATRSARDLLRTLESLVRAWRAEKDCRPLTLDSPV